MLQVSARIQIADEELSEKFVRASGPGGQNVNKVSTAVELRFNVARSPNLPEDVRARILGTADQRLNKDGELVIEASRFRSQDRNREDARTRLCAIILAATHVPKKRFATKPSRAAKERRLTAKKRDAGIKRTRTVRGSDE